MIEISKTSMRRSKPSYFFSILGVASLLILVGILGWFVINGSKLERYFRGSVQVQVYLRENAPQADIDSLMSYIRSKPYASAAEHVTKEIARDKFIKDGNEDWNKVLDYNPLPASIDFNLKSEYVNKDTLTNITADLSQNIIVSDIRYPDEVVSNLNNVVRKVGWVLIGAVTLLGILVLVLIDNTIKLAMFSNRFLIKTMQMVGATKSFIRKPFVMRSIKLGMIGAGLAIIALIGLLVYLETSFPDLGILDDKLLIGFVLLAVFGIGVLITLLSTYFATQRFLNLRTDDLY